MGDGERGMYVGLLILFCGQVAGASLVGTVTRNIRGGRLGSILPLTVNSESEVNDSPVLMKRASLADAKYYTNVAGAAFCRDETLAAYSCFPYCRNVTIGNAQVRVLSVIRDFAAGIKGYVAIFPSRKEVVVAFASERPQANRLTVFPPLLAPLKIDSGSNNTNIRAEGVAVHALLYATALRISDQYKDLVYPLIQRNGYKLMLTGHSVGAEVAALSTIVAHQKIGLPWPRIRYIGYGMVRVGNREFARWFNQQRHEATHVANFDDKLTHIPLRVNNFQHFGNRIFINKDKSVRFCDNSLIEDPRCDLLDPDLNFRDPHVKTFATEFGLKC